MIKIENTEVVGWEAAIRGMRNPMNSWEKSDSAFELICDDVFDECEKCPHYINDGTVIHKCDTMGNNAIAFIGHNDHELMMRLAAGGPVHAKYRRMITVYLDITAPLYWWKEFDTYKVGTVANSCSTMHKIAAKEFTLEDFSYEHLINVPLQLIDDYPAEPELLNMQAVHMMEIIIAVLNTARYNYNKTKDKKYWWQMIQLLPSSYNQKRTVMLNYEVLAGIYPMRKNHKLDEWREFCQWIETLPYSEIITGKEQTHG